MPLDFTFFIAITLSVIFNILLTSGINLGCNNNPYIDYVYIIMMANSFFS